jgi:ferrous iron transport protein B
MTSHDAASCATCVVANTAQVHKLGAQLTQWDYTVAIAGNPNTGKSTIFNTLTGLRQHTGNWSGKTVVRAEGGYRYQGAQYRLVDLPGTYSLLSTSADEEVARDFVLFGQPDATIVVTDATRLERNLGLVLQIMAITQRVVVAVNCMDEAERHGMRVDTRALARDLGVPVVAMTAHSGVGFGELLSMVAQVAMGAIQPKPYEVPMQQPQLEAAVNALLPPLAARFPALPNLRWVALRLIEGDASIMRAVADGTLGNLTRGMVPVVPLQEARI